MSAISNSGGRWFVRRFEMLTGRSAHRGAALAGVTGCQQAQSGQAGADLKMVALTLWSLIASCAPSLTFAPRSLLN